MKDKKAAEVIHAIAEGFSTLLTMNDSNAESDSDRNRGTDGDENADGENGMEIGEENIQRSPEQKV